MTAIQITIPLIFAVAAIAMTFFRRMPACLVAYAAFVSAGLLGVMRIPVDQYIIWGFIVFIDTINIYATRMQPTRSMQLYTVVGCLTGTLLGWLGGTLAIVMVGGALGAALGFLAYTRTPQGQAHPSGLAHRLSMFAGAACTAWFTFDLVAVVVAALFTT